MDIKTMGIKEIDKLLSEGLQLSQPERYQLADRLVKEMDRVSWLDEDELDYRTLSSLMEHVEPEFTKAAQMKLNNLESKEADITLAEDERNRRLSGNIKEK